MSLCNGIEFVQTGIEIMWAGIESMCARAWVSMHSTYTRKTQTWVGLQLICTWHRIRNTRVIYVYIYMYTYTKKCMYIHVVITRKQPNIDCFPSRCMCLAKTKCTCLGVCVRLNCSIFQHEAGKFIIFTLEARLASLSYNSILGGRFWIWI